MNKTFLKAILWKELVCFFRNTLGIVSLYILLLLGTNMFLPSMYMERGSITPWINEMLLNNIIVLAATVIVTAGSAIISQSMGLERREGILKVLLGIGLPPELIWLGQYLFAFCCSYVLWLVSFLLYFIGIQLIYGVQIIMTVQCLFLSLFVFPVIAILILAVYAGLFWTAKNQNTQLLYSLLPGIIYLLSFWLNQIFSEERVVISFWAAVGMLAGSILGVFLITRFIKRVDAERLFDS